MMESDFYRLQGEVNRALKAIERKEKMEPVMLRPYCGYIARGLLFSWLFMMATAFDIGMAWMTYTTPKAWTLKWLGRSASWLVLAVPS